MRTYSHESNRYMAVSLLVFLHYAVMSMRLYVCYRRSTSRLSSPAVLAAALFVFHSSLFPPHLYAQSHPAAQPVPYSSNFSTWAHSSSTLPVGWQGWNIGSTRSGHFLILPPEADQAVTPSGSASDVGGGVFNFNQKIGFQHGASLHTTLTLAIQTIGAYQLIVEYEISTIRNPYNSTTNTRIQAVELQYRIGTSGEFVSFGSPVYQNTTTQQLTGHEGQQSRRLLAFLPSECANQPYVQLRWVARDISGQGAFPSFALSAVSIRPNEAGLQRFYWNGSGPLTVTSSWSTAPDGSGSHPPDFHSPYQLFTIGHGTASLSTSWPISGELSQVVVADGATIHLQPGGGLQAPLTLEANSILRTAALPPAGQWSADARVLIDQAGASVLLPPALSYPSMECVAGACLFQQGNYVFNKDLICHAGATLQGPGSPFACWWAGDLTIEHGAVLEPSFSHPDYLLLQTLGQAHQRIALNGSQLRLRGLQAQKSGGGLQLLPGSPFLIGGNGDLRLDFSGPALFADGGNELTLTDDLFIDGQPHNYDFIGTLRLVAGGSEVQTIGTNANGVIPAALHHIHVLTTGSARVTFRPTVGAAASSNLLRIKGDLKVFDSGSTDHINFMSASHGQNTIRIEGDLVSERSSQPIFGSNTRIEMAGVTGQRIAGNWLIPRLILATAGKTSLSGTIRVGQSLTLNNGQVQIETGSTLTLASGALLTGADASRFFITEPGGFLQMEGIGTGGTVQEVLFHVGTDAATYRPLLLRNNGPADRFGVGVIRGVYQSYAPNGQPSAPLLASAREVDKTWVVSRQVPNASHTVLLTAHWLPEDQKSGFDPGRAKKYYYGSGWIPKGATSFGQDGVFQTATVTALFNHALSPIVIGDFNVPLSAADMRLHLAAKEPFVELQWQPRAGWRVAPARSADGVHFTLLDTLDTVVSTFADRPPAGHHGPLYYRLHWLGPEGEYLLSPVAVIVLAKQPEVVAAYPNPFTDALFLGLSASYRGGHAEIYSPDGRRLAGILLPDAPVATLPVNALPAAVFYLIRIHSQDKAATSVIRVAKAE